MSGNRELSIKITVNAGQSKPVVDALVAALSRLGLAQGKAGKAAADGINQTAGAAKQAANPIGNLEKRLKALADAGNKEAKTALTSLRASLKQFGPNSKEAAAALTQATTAIKTFQQTASKVGVGNRSLLGSSVVKTRNELAALGQAMQKTAQDAARSIGSGAGVAPLRAQLDQQIQATRRSLNDLKAAAAQYQALMKDKAAGVNIKPSEIKAAKAEVDRLTQAFHAEQAALTTLGASLANTANHTRNVAAANTAAAAASKAAAQAAQQQAQAQMALTRSVETARASIQSQIDTNRRNAYSFTIAGYQAQMAGSRMVDSFKAAANTFAEFDFTARRAAVTLGILEQGSAKTALGLGQFEREFQQVAITTKLFSPEEVAKGFYFWGSSTGQVVDSMSDLKAVSAQVVPIMKAAAMTGTDLEQALKGVYAITQQFNMGVGQSASVMDRLFYVTQKTALELPDLLNSFKMVGPVAAQANVSFEDMTSLLGAIGDAGIKGTMAGRAFRQFFIRLAKDSALTTELLDKQVVALGGVQKTWDELIFPQGKFIGMQETLNQFSRITAKLTQHQKEQVLASASTAGEYPVLTELVDANTRALTDNTGKLDLNRAGIIDVYNEQKNLADSTGSVEEQWAIMGESAKAVFGELANRIAPLTLSVGKSLVEAFRPIAQTIGDIAEAMTRWADANPAMFDLIVKIGAISAGLLTLMGTALLVGGAIKLFTGTVLKEFLVALIGNDAAVKMSTGSLGFYGAALGGARNKVVAFTAAIKAQSLALLVPNKSIAGIGQAVGGPGGLSSMLTRGAGAFRGLVSSGGRIGPLALIIGFIAGAAVGLVRGLTGAKMSMEGLGKAAGSLLGFLGEVVKLVVNIGMLFVKGGIAVGFLVGKFLNLIGTIPGMKLVADVLSNIAGFVGNIIGGVGEAFAGLNRFFDDLFANAERGMDIMDNAEGRPSLGAKGAGSSVIATYKDSGPERKMYAEKLQLQRDFEMQSTEQALAALSAQQEALAAEVAAHKAVVAQAAMEGIYLPVMDTLDALAFKTEESGALVAKSFATGFLGSGDEVIRASKTLSDTLITALASNIPKVRGQATQAMAEYATAFRDSAIENIPPAAAASVEFAIEAMKSKSPEMRQQGAELLAAFTDAIATGTFEQVAPAMLSMMDVALNQVTTMQGRAHDEGVAMIAALGRAIATSTTASEAVKAQVEGYIAMMASSDPAMQAIGANWIISNAKGLVSQMPMLRDLALRAGRDVQRYMAAGMSGDQARALATSTMMGSLKDIAFDAKVKAPPIFIPKVPGTSSPKGSTSPKGSKGSKAKDAKESNPLSDALQVAQNAAELAMSLKKIEGLDIRAMVRTSMGNVAEAMKLAITITSGIAKSVSTKTMQKVADFSASALSVAEAVGGMVTSFALVKDFKRIPTKTLKAVLDSVHELILLTYAKSKDIKGAKLGDASVYAEAATSITSAFGSAYESFAKIGEYKRVPTSVFKALAGDILIAVSAMIEATKGIKQGLVAAAAEFADSAGGVVSLIGDAFETFIKLKDYVRPLPGVLTSIVATTVEAVALMIVAMGRFNLSTAQLAAITAFSEASSAVVNAISATYDAFVKTISFVDQFRETIDFDTVFGWMEMAMRRMSAVAGQYTPEVIAKTKALAEAASAIAVAIEAFFGLGKNASQDPDALGAQVQLALDGVLASVASFMSAFNGVGVSIMQNLTSGLASQEAGLQAQVNRVENILGGLAPSFTFNVTGSNPQLTITHVIRDPDGALRNADAAQVAALLSGDTFISNLQHSAQTQ